MRRLLMGVALATVACAAAVLGGSPATAGESYKSRVTIREPEPVSLWVAYPLYISFVVFYPLNWLLNAASRSIHSSPFLMASWWEPEKAV